MTVYHYPAGLVFNAATTTPIASVDGDLYDVPNGTLKSVFDLNGTPLSHVTTSSLGFFPPFQTADGGPATGWLKFGAYFQFVVSSEAANGAAAASSAAVSATAAQTAQTAAQNAQTAAQNASTAGVTPSRLGSSPDGTKVLYGDGTWRPAPTGGGGTGTVDLSTYSLPWAWNYSYATSSWPNLPASVPSGVTRVIASGPSAPTPPASGPWAPLRYTLLLDTA